MYDDNIWILEMFGNSLIVSIFFGGGRGGGGGGGEGERVINLLKDSVSFHIFFLKY